MDAFSLLAKRNFFQVVLRVVLGKEFGFSKDSCLLSWNNPKRGYYIVGAEYILSVLVRTQGLSLPSCSFLNKSFDLFIFI